ncbi:hypothetical protein PHYPSEUDO_006052 [Phytophthora pseudosyringae]|uniref:Uncharacterized protein n=1 Tax=Phytophthora pseudosyringae TaxID=221518 RepID=A0A8T1VPR4_9STRA|nr:hypothetical protein PHYPSEUDO_006052 [Phytophthora pseudosyringae]
MLSMPEEGRDMNAIMLSVLDLIPVRRISSRVLNRFLWAILRRIIGERVPELSRERQTGGRDGAVPQVRLQPSGPARFEVPQDRRRTFPAVPDAEYGFHRLLDQRHDESGLEILVDWSPTWELVTNIDRAHVADFQAMLREQRLNERTSPTRFALLDTKTRCVDLRLRLHRRREIPLGLHCPSLMLCLPSLTLRSFDAVCFFSTNSSSLSRIWRSRVFCGDSFGPVATSTDLRSELFRRLPYSSSCVCRYVNPRPS